MGANRTAFAFPWALQSANVSPSVVGTAIAAFDTFLDLLAVVAPTDGVQASTAGASEAGDGLGDTYVYRASFDSTPVFPTSGRPVGDIMGAWVSSRSTDQTAVETVTNLGALTALPNTQKLVGGYSTVGDAGGGAFLEVPNSTTAVDGQTVVEITGGRAYRVHDADKISVRWGGALGTGGDDVTAIVTQSIALARAGVGAAAYLPTGDYPIKTGIASAGAARTRLIGPGASPFTDNRGRLTTHTSVVTGDNLAMFTIADTSGTPAPNFDHIEGVSFDGWNATTTVRLAKYGIRVLKSQNGTIRDVNLDGFFGAAIYVDGTAASSPTGGRVMPFQVDNAYLTRSAYGILIDEKAVLVDGSFTSMEFNRLAVESCDAGIKVVGAELQAPTVTISNSEVQSTTLGHGIEINNARAIISNTYVEGHGVGSFCVSFNTSASGVVMGCQVAGIDVDTTSSVIALASQVDERTTCSTIMRLGNQTDSAVWGPPNRTGGGITSIVGRAHTDSMGVQWVCTTNTAAHGHSDDARYIAKRGLIAVPLTYTDLSTNGNVLWYPHEDFVPREILMVVGTAFTAGTATKLALTTLNTASVVEDVIAYAQGIIVNATITGATNATPIVVTAVGHKLVTGDVPLIAGVTGNTAANGRRPITKIDADTFSIDASVGNGAYVSGGTAKYGLGLTGCVIDASQNTGVATARLRPTAKQWKMVGHSIYEYTHAASDMGGNQIVVATDGTWTAGTATLLIKGFYLNYPGM